jgi:hypothetical protein
MRDDTIDVRRAYWKKTLTELPALQLPTSRTSPRIASFSEATVVIELPLDLSNALKTLSSGRNGSDDFVTLLTAFKVLLARYSEQDDIVVASPIPTRYVGQADPTARLG